MIFRWSTEKNKQLIAKRSISFDEIQEAIESGNLIDARVNTKEDYKHQMKLLVLIDGYVWEVASIVLQEKPKVIYLVTAFRNRKENKKYRSAKDEK